MTLKTVAFTAAAWCLLSPVWADVTATVALTARLSLDLDTGAIGTDASGDLLYTGLGGVLAPVGNGTGVTLVNGPFDQLTQANLSAITSYVTAPLPDQALRPGAVIAAKTKSGK